jgi:hypothetical protein
MDIFSSKSKCVVATVIATLAAPPLLAQSAPGEQEQPARTNRTTEQPQVHIIEHNRIVGASVANGLAGDKHVALGSISDLVLDAQSGHIRYAVLASGGTLGIGKRQTPIEWGSLTWDAEQAQFSLGMTAATLEKLPEFDAESLRRRDGGTADAGASKESGNGGEPTNGGRERAPRGAARETHASLLLASGIGDCAVHAGKDQVGSGSTLFIESKTGCAAFLSVASGGVIGIGETNYVVPWSALRFVKPIDKQEMHIQLGKDKQALEAAPRLGNDGADVNKPEFREQIYEFYGVKRPAFEPKKAKGQDGSRGGR